MATKDDWHVFTMEAELGKHHGMVQLIAGVGLPAPNMIVDGILPALLFVRLGSILDNGLKEYLAGNNLRLIRPYRNDFNGRINFVADKGLLRDSMEWHRIRNKRNDLAHGLFERCTWEELQGAIDTSDKELCHLCLAAPKPSYEFFGQKTRAAPTEPHMLLKSDYTYGLKVGEQIVISVNWSTAHWERGYGPGEKRP